MRVLFVTWDGPQVAYLEGLFLPIFAGLKERNVHIDVLQFRWGDTSGANNARAACERIGIGYQAAKVARGLGRGGPIATALNGARYVRQAVRTFGSDIVMPRCLMPAIAVLAAGGARFRPILFDADGLPADERVEMAGDSPASLTYKILRVVEARTVRASAAVLVRTSAAANILARRSGVDLQRFQVVANGRDEDHFCPSDPRTRAQTRAELGISADAPVALYVGSVGHGYRFDLIREFALALARKRSDARLLVVTGSPDLAREVLGSDTPLSPLVLRASPDAIPRFIEIADLGLAFRKNCFSTQAVAPLKLAEYLMCGVPVYGTAAVGSTRSAVKAGVFIDEGVGADGAAQWFVNSLIPNREEFRARARATGVANFGLNRSIKDYHAAFDVFSRSSACRRPAGIRGGEGMA